MNESDMTRRELIEKTLTASAVAGVGAISSKAATVETDSPLRSDRRIRIGVVGGGFGRSFQWHEHPNCIVHAVSDLRKDRRDGLMQTYHCDRSYESLEKLILDKDIEAVAVFTGAPDHARHVTAVMNAGKHVISAVPACLTLEEAHQLKTTKERTGRKYMMAETSYYRQNTIAVRKLYQDGKFGELFYSEVEYYHPGIGAHTNSLSHYQGKPTWRYGYPPMLYVTHSTGFLVGVTRERLIEVSCLGWADKNERAFPNNVYKNPMSSAMGLFKTDRNHMCRCGVFWNGTAHGERAQWFGTKMAYYMPSSGGQPLRMTGPGAQQWSSLPNFWHMLPKSMRHGSGHGGSHTFITHEFISALCEEREPAVNLYEALAITAPGIVAHQSALQGGEQLKIPSFDRA